MPPRRKNWPQLVESNDMGWKKQRKSLIWDLRRVRKFWSGSFLARWLHLFDPHWTRPTFLTGDGSWNGWNIKVSKCMQMRLTPSIYALHRNTDCVAYVTLFTDTARGSLWVRNDVVSMSTLLVFLTCLTCSRHVRWLLYPTRTQMLCLCNSLMHQYPCFPQYKRCKSSAEVALRIEFWTN